MYLRLDSQLSDKKGTYVTFFLTMSTLMCFFSLATPPREAMSIDVFSTLSVLIRTGLHKSNRDGNEHP